MQLGQPIRYMLEHLGVDYEDKFWPTGPAPDFDRSEWKAAKFSLGLDFPNLPYFDDGVVKITHTHAIMRYLAKKHAKEMLGKNDVDSTLVDVLACEIYDVHQTYFQCAYFDMENKDKHIRDLKYKLNLLSGFLAAKTWMVGDYLTFPDFHAAEVLEALEHLEPGITDGYGNLQDYSRRFKDLTKIKNYLENGVIKELPFNSPYAQWGGK